jgi:dolichol kinase
LALILTDEWIFMASMLILGISDGLAAIVGLAFGDNNSYKVLGHTKSLAGSLAFFFSALIIMIVYTVLSGAPYSGLSLILLPAIAAVAENFAVNGTDNLVIPLLVALVLTSAV